MRTSILSLVAGAVFVHQTLAQACPSCTLNNYHCPSEDNSFTDTGVHYYTTGSSCCGNTLTCNYEGGGTTVVYTCSYSETSGALTADADHGLCPGNAVAGAQRRGIYAERRLKSRIAARTPERKRQVKDAMEQMGLRRSLGQGKASRTTEAHDARAAERIPDVL